MSSATTAARERPILFSGAMVRALLAGTKTQTRRVLKQATGRSLSVDMASDAPGVAELSWLHGDGPGHEVHETIKRVPCPYGAPGDRLWVREAWARTRVLGQEIVIYREGDSRTDCGGPWKPSIHMPRAVSRLLLEVVRVDVEQLHEISEADAIAEGIERHRGAWRCYTDANAGVACRYPVNSYRSLWESINGAESWQANPWVWVVEFKRVEA